MSAAPQYMRNRDLDHIVVETVWNGRYFRLLCGSILPGEPITPEQRKRECHWCRRANNAAAQHKRQVEP